MSVIKSMRRQHAVYWSKSGQDHYGKATFAAPVQIKCRWVDEVGEFRNVEGQVLMSKAHVYVDRYMKLGDKLKNGAMESTTPTDPKADVLAYDVIGFGDTPNFQATEHLLRAYL